MMELEAVLLQLLVPDNAVIQQATAELKVAFRSPAIIAALCSVLTGSQNPQVRQLAAVLLRRRAGRQWKRLTDDTKISLKPIILQILRDEAEHTVRRSAAHLAADVSRHEGATGKRWPELLHFLTHATRSHSPEEREVGMLVLSVVLDRAPQCMRPQHRDLLRLLQATLADGASALVPHYSARCLRAVIPLVGSDEMNAVRALVPRVMEAVVRLVAIDEDKACEAMEVFEEMIESEVSILASNIADLVRFSLQVKAHRKCCPSPDLLPPTQEVLPQPPQE
uniref:Importin-4-like n=1 Tax=Petromyzon marinus TaxID=7757 RepID=A0AAJ7SL58_PETMA